MSVIDKFQFFKGGSKHSKKPHVKSEKETDLTSAQPKAVPVLKKESFRAEIAPLVGKQILIKPIITEKASAIGSLNKYVFAVHPKANKVEIKKEINRMYNVNPKSVNIITMKGKSVRYGRTSGMTKNWKKAVVTLKQGQSIEVYKGA